MRVRRGTAGCNEGAWAVPCARSACRARGFGALSKDKRVFSSLADLLRIFVLYATAMGGCGSG